MNKAAGAALEPSPSTRHPSRSAAAAATQWGHESMRNMQRMLRARKRFLSNHRTRTLGHLCGMQRVRKKKEKKKEQQQLDIMREKCAHTPLMHAIGRTLPFPRVSPDPDTSGRPTHLSASPGAAHPQPSPDKKQRGVGGMQPVTINLSALLYWFQGLRHHRACGPWCFLSARRPLDQPTATPALGVTPEGFPRLQPESGAIPVGSSVPVSRGASVLDADFFFSLLPKTLFRRPGPVRARQNISRPAGATCCSNGEQHAH